MEPKKIVGIWIRVSTELQAQGDSPEHHEKRARLYAEAKGWEVAEVYHLEAVSGKSVIENSEAKRMLKDIKAGHITGLIFSKLARLARNTKELLDFADYFRKHEADLISLQEAIDTSTPAGRLFYTMLGAMAQWEREEIASRVAASVPIRAKLGKPISGHSPYGYKWVNKQLVVDENEAALVKLIYDLFLKHRRKKTVTTEINKMGYRSRKGSPFTPTVIRRILQDTAAKGLRRANYVTVKDGKTVLKPESEWIFVPCQPLISEEVWNECNEIILNQLKDNKTPGPKAVHLLSGLINCTCGRKMYVFHREKADYTCKHCNIRIGADDIHDIYYEQLKTFLLTETNVADYISKTNREIKEKEKQFAVLNNEAIAVRKRKTELINLRISNELTKETFAEQFKPMEERLTLIETQLSQLEAEMDILKVQHFSSDTVLQEAKDLYTRWPTLTFEQKRGIVEIITDSITVGKEDVHIKLNYAPNPTINPYSQNGGNSEQKHCV